jgi:hypothetical protein
MVVLLNQDGVWFVEKLGPAGASFSTLGCFVFKVLALQKLKIKNVFAKEERLFLSRTDRSGAISMAYP